MVGGSSEWERLTRTDREKAEARHLDLLWRDSARAIWFPIDPQHLLVLIKNSGKGGIWSVSKKRLELINLEITAHSFEAVIASSTCTSALDSLVLAATKPAPRISLGPSVGVTADGTEHPMGEFLHTWVPAYDQA